MQADSKCKNTSRWVLCLTIFISNKGQCSLPLRREVSKKMNIRSAQMHFIDSYQSMKKTKGRQAAMVAR
jgi:hypothetical protein